MGSVFVTVREVGFSELETHKECVRIALEHQTRIDGYSLPCELTEEQVWMNTLEGKTILLAEVGGVAVGVARISSLPHLDASEADEWARDHVEVGKYLYLFIANGCNDADRNAAFKALVEAALAIQSVERDGKRNLCVSLSSIAGDAYAIESLGRMGAVEFERGEDWFHLRDEVKGVMEDPLSDESGPDEWFGTPISVRKVDSTADQHERNLAALAFAAMTFPGTAGLVNDMAETVRDRIGDQGVYFAIYDDFAEEWGYLGALAVCDNFGAILVPTLSNASERTTAAIIAHLLRAAGYPQFHIEVDGLDSTILRVAGALGYSAIWGDDHVIFSHRVGGGAELDEANAVAFGLANESIEDADDNTAVEPVSDWDCIPTGIEELDWVTGGGLSRGKMFLMGSRNKSDATQLAKRIAASAVDRGLKVLYQAGWLTGQDGRECGFDSWVEDLRRRRDRGELDCVVIDNLQSMVPCPDGVSMCTWAKEMAMKTKTDIAMGLGLPVLLLARLRNLEDPKIAPSNKSWDWSTRIPDHADVAMIVHRPKRGELNLILTKNRSGELRTIDLDFDSVGYRLPVDRDDLGSIAVTSLRIKSKSVASLPK